MLLTTEVQYQLDRVGDTTLAAIINDLDKINTKEVNSVNIHAMLSVATHLYLTRGVDYVTSEEGNKESAFHRRVKKIFNTHCSTDNVLDYVRKIRLLSKRRPIFSLENVDDMWMVAGSPFSSELLSEYIRTFDDLFKAQLPEDAAYYRHRECHRLMKVVYEEGKITYIRYFLEHGKVISTPTAYYTHFIPTMMTFYEIHHASFPIDLQYRYERIRLTGPLGTTGDSSLSVDILTDKNCQPWLRAMRKTNLILKETFLTKSSFMKKVFDELVIPEGYNDEVVRIAAQMADFGMGVRVPTWVTTPDELIRRLQIKDPYLDRVSDLVVCYLPVAYLQPSLTPPAKIKSPMETDF